MELYNTINKSGEKEFPDWKDGSPNLQTFLTALNLSQPISKCQYELRMSRWPRTIFFAKNITIPGVTVKTVDLNHCGFVIPIPTHPCYESTEISMNIIADKEGYHYYDLRNMVLQTGHPLVAGDTRATIGEGEDNLDVRVRNSPNDETHHHWVIHNFRPTKIGEVELSVDSGGFLEFQLTGIFTHITYDCGRGGSDIPQSEPQAHESPEPSGNGGSSGSSPTSREFKNEFNDDYINVKREAVLFNYGLDTITDSELEKYDGEKEIETYRNSLVMSKSTLPTKFKFANWEKHIKDGEPITPDEYFEDRIQWNDKSYLDPEKKKRTNHRTRGIFGNTKSDEFRIINNKGI